MDKEYQHNTSGGQSMNQVHDVQQDINGCSPEANREHSSIYVAKDDSISLSDEEVSESEMVVSGSMQFPIKKTSSTDAANESQPNSTCLNNTGTSVSVSQNNLDSPSSSSIERNSGKCIPSVKSDSSELTKSKTSNSTDIDSSNDVANCGQSDSEKSENPKDELEYKLPSTVKKLPTEDGTEVYLVGTAHFSKESQDDVARTIRIVRPDIVMIELCKARTAVLQMDEETLLNESKNLDFAKMRMIMRQQSAFQGILYLLLLSLSSHITRELGMAPGGEFRTALKEARAVAPWCLMQLGDRPIHITLGRALASLSMWQKAKLAYHILLSKEPISKEEVEKCKQGDFIEEMLAEMTGQFPTISEVFVQERDIYLTKSLQNAAQPIKHQTSGRARPHAVVGVVGIGHVPGIVERWGKVKDTDIPPIMIIPGPTLSQRIMKTTFKYGFYSALIFTGYKCLPRVAKDFVSRPFITTLSSLKSFTSK